MLALKLAGGGASAVGGAAAGACGICIRKYIVNIPHPSECNCIGKIYWWLGCHTHKKFNLIAEVHDCTGVPKGKGIYVGLIAGRFSTYTQVVKEMNGKSEIYERLLLHVRQCDEFMEIRVYKHGIITSELLGSLYLNIKKDLEDKKFPKDEWYQLEKEGRSTNLKVNISFFKFDADIAAKQSVLFQQAVIAAQKESEQTGETLNLETFSSMNDIERLTFLSKGLEGPLKRRSDVGDSWSDLYFKAVKSRKNKWEWCWWESRSSCLAGNGKRGSIPFLAISLVLPYSVDRTMFYVRYHDTKNAYDVFFKRVDRDRNVWADGLYEFIDKLRCFLDKYPATWNNNEIEEFQGGRKHKKKKGKKDKITATSSIFQHNESTSGSNLDGVRRITSPRASFDNANNSTTGDSQIYNSGAPKSLAKIMAQARYYESDGEYSDDERTDSNF